MSKQLKQPHFLFAWCRQIFSLKDAEEFFQKILNTEHIIVMKGSSLNVWNVILRADQKEVLPFDGFVNNVKVFEIKKHNKKCMKNCDKSPGHCSFGNKGFCTYANCQTPMGPQDEPGTEPPKEKPPTALVVEEVAPVIGEVAPVVGEHKRKLEAFLSDQERKVCQFREEIDVWVAESEKHSLRAGSPQPEGPGYTSKDFEIDRLKAENDSIKRELVRLTDENTELWSVIHYYERK